MTGHNEAAQAHRNAAKAWRAVASAHRNGETPDTNEAEEATATANTATQDNDFVCDEAAEHAALAEGEIDAYYEHVGHGTEGEDEPDHARAETTANRVAKEHDSAAEQHEAYAEA